MIGMALDFATAGVRFTHSGSALVALSSFTPRPRG
jgi:hypothetical protein